LLIVLWPFVVPYRITLFGAGAKDASLAILLFGDLLLHPLVWCYVWASYPVFSGWVTSEPDCLR